MSFAQQVDNSYDLLPPHMNPNYKPFVHDLTIIKNKGDRDTLFLKQRFNPKEGYIRFNLDYDVLEIDTSWWQSGNGKYTVSYNGYIYDTDSIMTNGIPFYLSELKPRFTINANKEYTESIQEYVEMPGSENFNNYFNDRMYGTKLFTYFNDHYLLAVRIQSEETQSYCLDENDSLIPCKRTPYKDVCLDDLTIRTDTSGNVLSFYRKNRSQELLSPDKENGVLYFTYHPNGLLHERYRIDRDENKTGTYIRYSEQEIVVQSGSYIVKDSITMKNGTWNYYNDNGVPTRVEFYENGEMVSSQKFKIKQTRKKKIGKPRN